MSRSMVALAALMLCAQTTGCRPTFKASSTLSISGAPFTPSTCRVMTEAPGIELASTAGVRVTLSMPPQRLDAFKEIRATPRVAIQNGAAVDLGACGSLTLRGEGYHGDGRRAASGHLTLTCGESAKGELEFSGCF